jgi:small subunit ribosomal protein S27e
MSIMRKNNILIPKPRSNFVSVQCTQCGETRTIFTHTTTDIHCKSCGQLIAKKGGSKANILGKVLNTFD